MFKKKNIVSLLLFILISNSTILCVNCKPITIREGVSVYVIVYKKKTSKNTTPGESIKAKIHENVIIDNVTVFKKGDNALLYVSDVKSNGFIGNAGEILLYGATLYDSKGIKHSGEIYYKIKGEEKNYPKVLMTTGIIIWPLLLFGFVRGGHAKIPQMFPIEVRVKNDFIF